MLLPILFCLISGPSSVHTLWSVYRGDGRFADRSVRTNRGSPHLQASRNNPYRAWTCSTQEQRNSAASVLQEGRPCSLQ